MKTNKSKMLSAVAALATMLAGTCAHAADSQQVVAQTTIDRQPVVAQAAREDFPRWDFLVASGTLVPTGAQRGDIKRANLTAAQLLYVVRPELAFTATLGWARSGNSADQKLDLGSFDLGLEARPVQWVIANGMTLSPFFGVGAGARGYNTRSSDVDTRYRMAAYAGAGGDLGIRRVHVRLEVRDYVSGSSGQGTGGSRNDAVAMLGLYIIGQ